MLAGSGTAGGSVVSAVALIPVIRIERAFALLLFAALVGCARADYATVTIAYQARSQSQLNVELPAKQRIATSFKRIAKEQGYKCNERGKRTEEIICVGP
jgi:hypothetical protein